MLSSDFLRVRVSIQLELREYGVKCLLIVLNSLQVFLCHRQLANCIDRAFILVCKLLQFIDFFLECVNVDSLKLIIFLCLYLILVNGRLQIDEKRVLLLNAIEQRLNLPVFALPVLRVIKHIWIHVITTFLVLLRQFHVSFEFIL